MAVVTVVAGEANVVSLRFDIQAKKVKGLIKDYIDDVAKEIQREARLLVGHRTGNLARAIEVDGARKRGRWGTAGGVNINIRKAPYGVYVNEGTGLFGPKGSEITAKAGNVLAFKVPGKRKPIFARTVKGQKGQHFMEKAFESVMTGYAHGRTHQLMDDIVDV